MPFTQDNDVIEAFTPDRSDNAFRVGVLPRGSGGCPFSNPRFLDFFRVAAA